MEQKPQTDRFCSRGSSAIPPHYVVAGCVIPTVITWVYFILLADADPTTQKLAFGFGKLFQFSLMTYALYRYVGKDLPKDLLLRDKLNNVRAPFRWIVLGASSGIAIGLIVFCSYLLILMPSGAMDRVAEEARKKLDAFGAHSMTGLVLLGAIYSLIHSLLEEFYWRSFVFRGTAQRLGVVIAIYISSIGFMAHHVLVLAKYFGYQSIWTYLCSLGVSIGGFIWAWMAHKSGSISASWVSHALVDAAIFAVGIHLLFF